MARGNHSYQTCPVCSLSRRAGDMMDGGLVRPPIVELIRQKSPQWSPADSICLSCVNRFRADYVEDILEKDKGELSKLEEEVVTSLRDQEDILAENINPEFDRQLTFGERMADKIAEFGGSWSFILSFGLVLLLWIALNSFLMARHPFDPYPYILLNLVLSCLAALQAPIIMMSQNRQEARDRLRAEHDYRVNLKAELEIRLLHGKIDQLLTNQWQRLLEIQKIQMEMMARPHGPAPRALPKPAEGNQAT
ncbi:MAG: DUF1003 domain-containing protein [Candidatus Tectomicrobia bacterium]|uniref:DUF1003 domain-containing protein n=1 Tax=Tectimicrobiota bacterium TaxID=2528274 RepID=A0A932HXT9_UNCTE|nr:DUF1003 domain-containing protein [Candidatus Tectomicrobia bacterium]